MNSDTPQPEGSIRSDDGFDPIAALISPHPPASHWACGMPLSYVQEMADYWLDMHNQSARLDLPAMLSMSLGDSPDVTTK